MGHSASVELLAWHVGMCMADVEAVPVGHVQLPKRQAKGDEVWWRCGALARWHAPRARPGATLLGGSKTISWG